MPSAVDFGMAQRKQHGRLLRSACVSVGQRKDFFFCWHWINIHNLHCLLQWTASRSRWYMYLPHRHHLFRLSRLELETKMKDQIQGHSTNFLQCLLLSHMLFGTTFFLLFCSYRRELSFHYLILLSMTFGRDRWVSDGLAVCYLCTTHWTCHFFDSLGIVYPLDDREPASTRVASSLALVQSTDLSSASVFNLLILCNTLFYNPFDPTFPHFLILQSGLPWWRQGRSGIAAPIRLSFSLHFPRVGAGDWKSHQ